MSKSTREQKKFKAIPASRGALLEHFLLVAPVFLLYHIGLLISPRAANGADFSTRLFGYLLGLSQTAYLALVGGLVVVYALWVRYLKRKGRFSFRRMPRVLIEAALYALIMGPLASLILHELHVIGWMQAMGPIDKIVASAGAGFYEELLFRLLGIGVFVFWFSSYKLKSWLVRLLALMVSSVLFALVHYIGPGGDPWQWASFAFRIVMGVMLGVIFMVRGFAPAVYAHFLYDVYVMCVLNG